MAGIAHERVGVMWGRCRRLAGCGHEKLSAHLGVNLEGLPKRAKSEESGGGEAGDEHKAEKGRGALMDKGARAGNGLAAKIQATRIAIAGILREFVVVVRYALLSAFFVSDRDCVLGWAKFCAGLFCVDLSKFGADEENG